MLVLSVQLDQTVSQLPEGSGSGERAVNERSAPPLARDLPADNYLRRIGGLEDCLDRGLRLAGSDQISRGARSQKEAYGLDEDGLSCSRFTSEDVEAWLELDLDRLDHGEVANAKQAKHVGGTSIVSYV